MALVTADRVKETTTTTGTDTLTLGGAVTGFQSFSAIGNGNTAYCCCYAVDGNGVPTGQWEVFLGTYTASGTTLARTTLLSSSTGNAINFSAGTKHVIVCLPSNRAAMQGIIGGLLLEGVAILAPNGNDTTGAVGTSTTAPVPYATAQAAYDDGAKILVLMPKSGTYGNIQGTGVQTINLTVISYHDPSIGSNQLGTISTASTEISIHCTTGPRSCRVGTVFSRAASVAGGVITIDGFTTSGDVDASGDSTDGTNGGQITMRNFIAQGAIISVAGGQGVTPGATGGTAGLMDLSDGFCNSTVYVSVSGGSGTTGAAGDAENPGQPGGNGGSAGTLTTKRLNGNFIFYANGGALGGGGSDGGAGAGSDGAQGNAGTIDASDCNIDECHADSAVGAGVIEIRRTSCGAVSCDGSITSRFADHGTPTGSHTLTVAGSIINDVFTAS